MDEMQGPGALLARVSLVRFPSKGSTRLGCRYLYLHSFQRTASRGRRKKSGGSEWDEQGDRKTSFVKLGLPGVVQRRLAAALGRWSLDLPTVKRQRYVRHPARQQACRLQESYVLLQEAVAPGKGLVGLPVSP